MKEICDSSPHYIVDKLQATRIWDMTHAASAVMKNRKAIDPVVQAGFVV